MSVTSKTKIWPILALLSLWLAWSLPESTAQNRPPLVRTAYSALSAGIGTLWLSHDDGYFKKHGGTAMRDGRLRFS